MKAADAVLMAEKKSTTHHYASVACGCSYAIEYVDCIIATIFPRSNIDNN